LTGISVIIPVYNEKNSIESTLKDVVEALQRQEYPFEIIVVNDGSVDGTAEKLRELAGRFAFRQLRHIQNNGYGASLKTGIRQARYPVIAITDADGTYPNEDIPQLVWLLEPDITMVVGSRTGLSAKIPSIRHPAKWFIKMLAQFLSGHRIPDVNSGLRVFRKKEAMRYFQLLPNGFSFTTTITLSFLVNGYNVIYHPISYFKREGKSKIRPIHDTLNFVHLVMRTVVCFNPLKVFIPLGIVLFLLAFAVNIVSIVFWGLVLETVFAVLVVGAVQVLSIGLVADLIQRRIYVGFEQEVHIRASEKKAPPQVVDLMEERSS
jgi:glycosyltransferase involved in cell wall biosynthesis